MALNLSTPQQVFDAISQGLAADPSVVSKVGGVFHFKVADKSWTVDLKNGAGSVKSGAPSGSVDCTLIVPSETDFVNLMTGKVNGQTLFMQGKVKIQGNMALVMKLDKIPKGAPATSSAAPAASSSPAADSLKSAAVFDELAKRIASNPDLVQAVGGIYQFEISRGNTKQSWTVDLKNGKGSVKSGAADKADCVLTLGDDDFVGMMQGKLNSQQLFMQGKLKIKGNMGIAMKLSKLQQPKAAL
jgi:3-hydroxyacyl-CoA dehydrogenase/3a,7a,12a-trihydroxy-5b-cholest-24-enoyl-CoA hydratase